MRKRRAHRNILFILARTSPSSTVWVDHVRTFITLFNPSPGKLSNRIFRFLAWQAVYFNELLWTGHIINVTVRLNRQRACKAWRGIIAGPDKAVDIDIEYFELCQDCNYSCSRWCLAPATVVLYIYIYIYIFLRFNHRPKSLVTDAMKSFLHWEIFIYTIYFQTLRCTYI